MIILALLSAPRSVYCCQKEGGRGWHERASPSVGFCQSLMRGNYERGKGNINVLTRGSDSLYTVYVISIWPGSISGIFSRVPRSPVWAAQITSLFRLREQSPAPAHNRCTHRTRASLGHENFIKSYIKVRLTYILVCLILWVLLVIDKYFDAENPCAQEACGHLHSRCTVRYLYDMLRDESLW